MVARQLLFRAFIRAAKKNGDSHRRTPIAVVEGILLGGFTAEATEGKTLVTSTENGGTVTFNPKLTARRITVHLTFSDGYRFWESGSVLILQAFCGVSACF